MVLQESTPAGDARVFQCGAAAHLARWARMLAAQREREARNLRRHAEKPPPRPEQ